MWSLLKELVESAINVSFDEVQEVAVKGLIGLNPCTRTLGLAEAVAPGQAVGIDIESSMVEQATTFAKDRQVPNVRFEVADITDIPYSDNTFDRAFCCAVLEHLPDPVKALKEAYRVLKPGGIAGLIKTKRTMAR